MFPFDKKSASLALLWKSLADFSDPVHNLPKDGLFAEIVNRILGYLDRARSSASHIKLGLIALSVAIQKGNPFARKCPNPGPANTNAVLRSRPYYTTPRIWPLVSLKGGI